MVWLEVIKLRSAGRNSVPLAELSRPMRKMAPRGLAEIKAYRHAALETDFSLHLYWEGEPLEQNGSTLGLRLAQAFKEFGLVDHSVWIEDKK